MQAADVILLFAIAHVIAWPVTLYLETNQLRLIGHLIICTVGSFVGGYIAITYISSHGKFTLIACAFTVAGSLLYLTRFHKWRRSG